MKLTYFSRIFLFILDFSASVCYLMSVVAIEDIVSRMALCSTGTKRTSSVCFAPDAILGNRRMSSFLRNPSMCLFADDSYESRQKNVIIKRTWWKEAVVYQVYWRSFYDSNGDGIGDLQGVIDKLDYIRSLGVGIIWLNPFYESPDYDNGYDVSNYTSVMKIAGDLDTFDRLLWEIHSRRMKLIIDLVVNHTSYKHEWFVQSRSGKDNPKRDWYIWSDPTPQGEPPTNWKSYFTESTWEYDELTKVNRMPKKAQSFLDPIYVYFDC